MKSRLAWRQREDRGKNDHRHADHVRNSPQNATVLTDGRPGYFCDQYPTPNRYPIQTEVHNFDKMWIRNDHFRDGGGQVFLEYIVNIMEVTDGSGAGSGCQRGVDIRWRALSW